MLCTEVYIGLLYESIFAMWDGRLKLIWLLLTLWTEMFLRSLWSNLCLLWLFLLWLFTVSIRVLISWLYATPLLWSGGVCRLSLYLICFCSSEFICLRLWSVSMGFELSEASNWNILFSKLSTGIYILWKGEEETTLDLELSLPTDYAPQFWTLLTYRGGSVSLTPLSLDCPFGLNTGLSRLEYVYISSVCYQVTNVL